MSERFFIDAPIAGETAVLRGPEAHHLSGVMRVRVGDEVLLFDGSGAEFPARVEAIERREVRLAVLSRNVVDRELPRDVTLCSALPRGDRQRWLIEKAVELGVRRFVPLRTNRAVVEPDSGTCERLRRTVIEASKQCGRNRLMEITAPSDAPPTAAAGALNLLAHPGGETTLAQLAEELRAQPSRPIALLVGPEGGFTDEEAAAAQSAGWRPVSLGPRILRIETAATALAAWAATH
jgi:16S rRNA (uracil1498-N3)-methyltransferase